MSNQPVWKTYHVVTLLVAVFTCMLLGSLVGALLSRFAFGYAPRSPEDMFVGQLFGTFLGLQIGGIVSFHFFLKWHHCGWRTGFGIGRPIRSALIGLAACVLFLPLAWGLQSLVKWALLSVAVEPKLQSTVVAIQEKAAPAWRSLALAALAVAFAPIIEELMFRGVLYRWIRDRGRPRLALWFSALVFGLVHFNVLAFLPLTLFGALLAWLYRRSGNLLVPIFTHCFFNLINLVVIVYQEPLAEWLKLHT